jgi:hypothetical protein
MHNLARLFAMALRAVFLLAVASSTADAALVRFVATGFSEAKYLPEFENKPSSFELLYDTDIEPTATPNDSLRTFSFGNSVIRASVTVSNMTWCATDIYNLGMTQFDAGHKYELLSFAARTKTEPENAAYQPVGMFFILESFFGNSNPDKRLFESSGLPTDAASVNLMNATTAIFALTEIPVPGAGGLGAIWCNFSRFEIQVIPEPSAFAGALILLLGQWCSFGRYARQQCQ